MEDAVHENKNKTSNANVNKKHKASLFSGQFSDRRNFLELCNALAGTDYDENTPMIETTLEDALFMEQVNDVSFLVDDKLMVFIEHQSTINFNMALRLLMYAGRIYEKVIDPKSLYRNKAIQIPRPEFYVLYNGPDEFPERMTLRLSDMFPPDENKKNAPALELVVEIYNINKGYNPELLSKCKALCEYETFVELVDKYRKKTGDLKKAAKLAVAECSERGILTKFIQKFASEVENMIFTKWNTEDAKVIWREEGREDGLEAGRKEMAKAMKAEGLDVATIAKITNLTVDDILRLENTETKNMIFTKWNTEDAKVIWREDGREEGRNEIFALLETGVSLEEAKKMFKPKQNTPQKLRT
ncbi:MAG: Rpn family recombination-promoting nuclease/putative transposase [Chitinispirillales bacterium]|jgi:predicted transposase/invertase (TIGR01784 family)|nr:Rpn family recombination-promoting nuclease/putative transposase [Chitinispirillales bacterium]